MQQREIRFRAGVPGERGMYEIKFLILFFNIANNIVAFNNRYCILLEERQYTYRGGD